MKLSYLGLLFFSAAFFGCAAEVLPMRRSSCSGQERGLSVSSLFRCARGHFSRIDSAGRHNRLQQFFGAPEARSVS